MKIVGHSKARGALRIQCTPSQDRTLRPHLQRSRDTRPKAVKITDLRLRQRVCSIAQGHETRPHTDADALGALPKHDLLLASRADPARARMRGQPKCYALREVVRDEISHGAEIE